MNYARVPQEMGTGRRPPAALYRVAHDMCDDASVAEEGDTCKRCGAAILWGLNDKRHRVPIERALDGLLILLSPEKGSGFPEPRIVEVLSPGDPVEARYRRHVETCSGKRRR